MHKEEIRRLIGKVEQKGFTLVPLDLHYKGGRVKAEIALAKGKAEHDKRNTEKKRDWEREHGRLMRHKVIVASQALTRAAVVDAEPKPCAPRRRAALREIDDLPRPPGLPLVGNTAADRQAACAPAGRGLGATYGAFFTLRIGGRRMLVVADHEAMGALLRDRPDGFRRTPQLRRDRPRDRPRRPASSAPRARPGSGSGGW